MKFIWVNLWLNTVSEKPTSVLDCLDYKYWFRIACGIIGIHVFVIFISPILPHISILLWVFRPYLIIGKCKGKKLKGKKLWGKKKELENNFFSFIWNQENKRGERNPNLHGKWMPLLRREKWKSDFRRLFIANGCCGYIYLSRGGRRGIENWKGSVEKTSTHGIGSMNNAFSSHLPLNDGRKIELQNLA